MRACHFVLVLASVAPAGSATLDRHGVALEHLLVRLLLRFQPTVVVPRADDGVAHVRQRWHASLRAFAEQDQVHAKRGFDRSLPSARRQLADLRREGIAELPRDLAGRQRREVVVQHERVGHRGDAGRGAAVQPGEQPRGVALEVGAVLLRVEIDLPERELRRHPELVGVGLQIR